MCSPIGSREIPGILAVVGCSNYPKGGKAVYDICRRIRKKTLHRSYFSGVQPCQAGSYKNSEGQTLYEEFLWRLRSWRRINTGFLRKQRATLQAQQLK